MPRRSISLRLILGASLWIIVTLVVTGVVLTGLFRKHVERAFDIALNGHIEELLTFSGVDKNGNVVITRHPSDPQFNKPLSGWYWEMRTADGKVERSRSLWDQKIPFSGTGLGEKRPIFLATGPRNETLRILNRTFTLPESDEPFSILVAGPASDIETAVRSFATVLVSTLVVLGLGLIGAVFLQVRFGLYPLKRMRDVLSEIRAGRIARMEGSFATEIEPLAAELNALLDHSSTIIERARTQAGNMAHALKTPLAVISNEADRLGADSEAGKVIGQHCKIMMQQISHNLSRARAAGAHGVLGIRSDVSDVADGLRRTLLHIYTDKGIQIAFQGVDGKAFMGEREDLEEMLGNLMDNACKWAKSKVRVRAEGDEDKGCLYIFVEDDGPGIPDQSMDEVLGRGRRLDETVPGSGLGLPIVRDIAELYGGSLELSRSRMGGLCTRLRLPGS